MKVGVVVIGRNEGERLRICLQSAVGEAVVYVDSGSSDGSVALARAAGVDVLELDMTQPFCAARARNAGFARLIQGHPELRFVQFIDGDCEFVEGWLPAAADTLEALPELAVVAGRLHERFPEASIFNRLGDLEWNFAGIGEVESVGGIFMIRREAFERVGGFDATVPAGEEPELCQRLIRCGWRLCRLDMAMAWHDLAMTRFSQWWRRMVRFGYGSMDVAERFGLPRFRRNNWRARFWSAWLCAVTACVPLAFFHPPNVLEAGAYLAIVALWPAQLARIALRTWRKGQPAFLSAAYAFFMMIVNWPHMVGQLLYWTDRRRKRSLRLVEYKMPAPAGRRR